MTRVTEAEVGVAVLRILASQPSGSATIPRLKKEIPSYLKLSPEDRTPSLTREGEEVWEQQVRNLVSHRRTAGNIVHDGFAAYAPKRLTITDLGRRVVA